MTPLLPSRLERPTPLPGPTENPVSRDASTAGEHKPGTYQIAWMETRAPRTAFGSRRLPVVKGHPSIPRTGFRSRFDALFPPVPPHSSAPSIPSHRRGYPSDFTIFYYAFPARTVRSTDPSEMGFSEAAKPRSIKRCSRFIKGFSPEPTPRSPQPWNAGAAPRSPRPSRIGSCASGSIPPDP